MKPEELRIGDTVYVLYANGYISKYNGPISTIQDKIQQGNIFRTEEEAIHERERRNLMTDLRKFADFEPDWKDYGQYKYSLWFDQKRWRPLLGWAHFSPYQIYFPSKEKGEIAIEKFSDRLKYLLPYKE